MTDHVRAGTLPPGTAGAGDVVLALYRSIDEGRASDAVDLFAEDAVLEAAGRRHSGTAAISAVLASRQARTERVTRHVLTDVRVSADGVGATLTAALTVFVLSGPSPTVPEARSDLDVRLARSDGRWRIHASRSTRSADRPAS